MVVDVFHDWSEADVEHGEVFEGLRVPVDLDLLSFGAGEERLLGDDLSSDVDLVGHVEDVETDVVGDVGEVDFFVGVESESGQQGATA